MPLTPIGSIIPVGRKTSIGFTGRGLGVVLLMKKGGPAGPEVGLTKFSPNAVRSWNTDGMKALRGFDCCRKGNCPDGPTGPGVGRELNPVFTKFCPVFDCWYWNSRESGEFMYGGR